MSVELPRTFQEYLKLALLAAGSYVRTDFDLIAYGYSIRGIMNKATDALDVLVTCPNPELLAKLKTDAQIGYVVDTANCGPDEFYVRWQA